ncbi:Ribosomal protein L18ae family [Euphorbia peplus]|nr:Ribosomal protein L18ae family [Euphorbia peplus]
MEDKNNRVNMEQYGYPVVDHSTPPAWAPSAPVATAIPINDHSVPVQVPGPGPGAPQAVSVVNNVVVSPGAQYGHLPVTGYAVVEVKPPSLPCCGIGVGWFMFIFGWFIAITWYAGAIVLLCSKVDPRERPGYIGCSIMAIIMTILVIILSVGG